MQNSKRHLLTEKGKLNSLASFVDSKTALLDNSTSETSKNNINITIKAEKGMGFQLTIR